MGQADSAAVGVAEGAGQGVSEVELERPRDDDWRRLDGPDVFRRGLARVGQRPVHGAAVEPRGLVLVDGHAGIGPASGAGTERECLDLAGEDAHGRRARLVDGQAELGAEVDNLVVRGEDGKPLGMGRHARRQLALEQPGRASREQLEAGRSLEDDPCAAVELDLGQPALEAERLARHHVPAGPLARLRPEAILGIDQPGDVRARPLPGDRRAAARPPDRKPCGDRSRGCNDYNGRSHARDADPPARPEPEASGLGPRSILPALAAGFVRPRRELLHDRIGRPARADRELDLRVVLEVVGEESPRRLALEQEGLEPADARFVDEARAVFIDQVVQLDGELGRGPERSCYPPVCHRTTHALEQRATDSPERIVNALSRSTPR